LPTRLPRDCPLSIRRQSLYVTILLPITRHATALSPHSLFCCRFETMGYKEEQCGGGESVSQSQLKDKAFSIFLN
jgi:hypothetical protein